MTACVQVFGRRHDEAIHALRRPASEKRQCTKSRECGTRQCGECYEDRMLVAISMVDAARAECFHNFRILARTLHRSIFNVLGSCNFKWLRVAETAHPTTIARLIGRSVFGGMVRINFLRVEISTAHSSKLGLRYSSRQLCHCVMAGSM